MRVISRKHLVIYWTSHPDAESSLTAWYDEAAVPNWRTPRDIKDQYRDANFSGITASCSTSRAMTIA